MSQHLQTTGTRHRLGIIVELWFPVHVNDHRGLRANPDNEGDIYTARPNQQIPYCKCGKSREPKSQDHSTTTTRFR